MKPFFKVMEWSIVMSLGLLGARLAGCDIGWQTVLFPVEFWLFASVTVILLMWLARAVLSWTKPKQEVGMSQEGRDMLDKILR